MALIIKRAKYMGPARAPSSIRRIILHALDIGTPQQGVNYIVNPEDGRVVSYHKIILGGNNDVCVELVPDTRIAWHAKYHNRDSIGICVGTTDKPLSAYALATAKRVVSETIKKYGIKLVQTHSHLNPQKHDPGKAIDHVEWGEWLATLGVTYEYLPATNNK